MLPFDSAPGNPIAHEVQTMSRLRFLSVVAAAFGAVLLSDPLPFGSAQERTDRKPGKVVALAIDFGDGFEKRYTALPWTAQMTVADALEAARRHPRGIQWEARGSGVHALLIKIDDLANEGRGRNWIYRVNGKLAEVGIGEQKLEPGDSILWKFEEYR